MLDEEEREKNVVEQERLSPSTRPSEKQTEAEEESTVARERRTSQSLEMDIGEESPQRQERQSSTMDIGNEESIIINDEEESPVIVFSRRRPQSEPQSQLQSSTMDIGNDEHNKCDEEESPVIIFPRRRPQSELQPKPEPQPQLQSLTMEIGDGVFIPWYAEDQRRSFEFDGGGCWDVPIATQTIYKILCNRDGNLLTFQLRSTIHYTALISHSRRKDGTHKFLFKVAPTDNNSSIFPRTSPEASVGIENSLSEPLFWQLTSGNQYGRLPEQDSRSLEVLMRVLRHFLRLLNWVNSNIHENFMDQSISFINTIIFSIESTKEKDFADILRQRKYEAWKDKGKKRMHCALEDFRNK